MATNENRLNRINEELRKEISNIISFELKNPDATGLISVTKVKVTPDLKYAKVYVSILDSKNETKTVEALKKSAGFIRSMIAKSVNLRVTPELVFEKDDSLEYGMKIDSILKDLKKNTNGWEKGRDIKKMTLDNILEEIEKADSIAILTHEVV